MHLYIGFSLNRFQQQEVDDNDIRSSVLREDSSRADQFRSGHDIPTKLPGVFETSCKATRKTFVTGDRNAQLAELY